MPKKSFVYGAAILFGANLFNRLLGFVYQYLIMRFIGSEAYGLFHMVFPVYMTALVFTTAGIPLAISKMISEKVSIGCHEEAYKIFKIALIVLFISGAAVSLILFLNIPFIVERFFSDKRVIYVFKICIPSIFIVSIASAFRGYFQGLQNMIPSAVSQICEQIFRIIVGFFLALKMLNKGVEWAAAGLALGMLGGEFLGLIVIYIQYLYNKVRIKSTSKKSVSSSKTILFNLFTLALPVTGSRLMSTGLSALDAVIIPRQLQIAGNTARQATSLFGQLSGTALTLLTFPSVFTFALATSLVPAISEAMAKKDFRSAKVRCADAMRLTIILGLPCIIVLYYFAQPLSLFFNSRDVIIVLQVLALGGIFTYLQQTTTGILQGLGKTYLPLLHSIISAAIRIPLLIYLTALPKWGLIGSAWAYVLGYVCLALMNIIAITRHIKMEFKIKAFILQPLSAGLGMIIMIRLISKIMGSSSIIVCLLTSSTGFLFYCSFLYINGGITKNDLRRIPFLGKYFN